MRLCIRDDDTSFYTQPEELEKAYFSMNDIPITFSVVPFTVSDHTGNHPYGIRSEMRKYAPVGENQRVVAYLKDRIKQKTGEVVLHAIHHEYKKASNDRWLAETEFLKKNEMKEGILKGKEYLEDIFGSSIDIFIPASNVVSNDCAEILDEIGLNTNSVFTRRFTRKPTPAYVRNYVKSNVYKLLHGGRYSGILEFPNHKELCVHRFWSCNDAMEKLLYSIKYDFPLVLYTHYWDLNRNNELREDLVKFTQEAIRLGAEPSLLSECFK